MSTHYYLTRIATPEEESTLYKFGFEVPKDDKGYYFETYMY